MFHSSPWKKGRKSRRGNLPFVSNSLKTLPSRLLFVPQDCTVISFFPDWLFDVFQSHVLFRLYFFSFVTSAVPKPTRYFLSFTNSYITTSVQSASCSCSLNQSIVGCCSLTIIVMLSVCFSAMLMSKFPFVFKNTVEVFAFSLEQKPFPSSGLGIVLKLDPIRFCVTYSGCHQLWKELRYFLCVLLCKHRGENLFLSISGLCW